MKKLVALVLALVMVMGMTAWAEDTITPWDCKSGDVTICTIAGIINGLTNNDYGKCPTEWFRTSPNFDNPAVKSLPEYALCFSILGDGGVMLMTKDKCSITYICKFLPTESIHYATVYAAMTEVLGAFPNVYFADTYSGVHLLTTSRWCTDSAWTITTWPTIETIMKADLISLMANNTL